MPVRNVSNWTDLNNALRELFNFKDLYTTKNIDFSGRRINNASPGVDPNDYVILSQLPSFTATQQPFSTKRGSGTGNNNWDKITFGIASGGPVTVGTGFTPPFIWSLPTTGIPLITYFACNIAPTGADIKIDLLKNGTSFLQTPLDIPAGSAALTVFSFSNYVTNTSFTAKDVVTPVVLQVGSNIAGQGIEVVTVCTLG